MRARYYSPEMRRFVNADILHGKISDATSLNRYSYVNGNPVSFVDPFGLERKDPYDYGENKALLIKTLKMAKAALSSYVKHMKEKDSILAGYEDVYKKLMYAIENDLAPDVFIDGIKVQFVIEPGFNTSGYELLMELAGFVPVLDIAALVTEYDSMENKDDFFAFDLAAAVAGEDSIEQKILGVLPTDISKALSFLGKISTGLEILAVAETLWNWDSLEKLGTEIFLHVSYGDFIYQYHAVVDQDFSFTKMGAGATGLVIKPEDDMFEIRVE